MKRMCLFPGCYKYSIDNERYCEEHIERAIERSRNKPKPFETAVSPNAEWYKTARWRRLSARIREEHPYCEYCSSEDQLQVHHLKEGYLSEEDFFDEEYLVVVCRRCHQKITQAHIDRSR